MVAKFEIHDLKKMGMIMWNGYAVMNNSCERIKVSKQRRNSGTISFIQSRMAQEIFQMLTLTKGKGKTWRICTRNLHVLVICLEGPV